MNLFRNNNEIRYFKSVRKISKINHLQKQNSGVEIWNKLYDSNTFLNQHTISDKIT